MDHDRRRGERERYLFDFDVRFYPFLSVLGVGPSTAGVVICSGVLHVRFGPWVVETPLANVAEADTTGPYNLWKTLGTRVSLADRGLTFATNTRSGLCVRFHEPVRGADPFGLLRHPGLTMTVADPTALAERLSR
jgi:hypothetical protein